MAATKPSIFLGGLRLLLANKRTLLWSYLALLVVGLIGGASTRARTGPFLDHSLAAQKFSVGIDVAYYAELFQHVNEHDPGSGPVTAALTLLSVVLAFFFAAGFLYVFLSGERPRLATILKAGIDYFWRFFRLTLFAAVFAGILLGALGWLRSTYLTRADEKYVEAAYDVRALLTLAVLLLVAVILRLWFDVAEAYVVQMGREGDRRVRRSLGPAFGLLRRHFGHLLLSYFTAGAIGVLGFGLFVWIWAAEQTSQLLLPVFLLSQVGMLFLLASRIWQRGIVAALVLATREPTQTVIVVEPGPHDPYPFTPILSDIGGDGSIELPPAPLAESAV